MFNSSKQIAAIVALLVASWSLPGLVHGAFDGFNVLSGSFAHQFNGDQIWDGAAYANGWDGAATSGGTTADYSLNGTNLSYNMSTNNGWLQQDNGSTPWELGSGSWTVEVRARVGATGGNSGFVIWGALNGERDILTIRENSVTNLAGTVFDTSNNTSGFHDFRLVYDAGADVYHYFRDSVQLTPLTGVPQQAGTANTRLIIGDCCSTVAGTPFGGVGSSFEIEYVRYDMTGAFSPTDDQGIIAAAINRDTGNISLTNTTSTPIASIIGYTILSPAGGLSQANWNQQAAGSQLTNDNDSWTVITAAGSTTDLGEAVFATAGDGDGGDLAASTGNWNFGNVWRASPFEDVSIELLLDDGSVLTSGVDFQISYVGNGEASIALGDLAGATINDGPDGDIDLVDWIKFKAGFGADLSAATQVEAYFAGDLNADGFTNASDFNLFRQLYDASNGAGAFLRDVSGTAVPEPATWSLAAVAIGLALLARRRLVAVAACCAVMALFGTAAHAQVPVSIFADNFQAYPLGDPANFAATGNWTHNGAGTAPNTSRIFDTVNFGGTRLWIASAANAAAGTGLNSRGIAQSEGLASNTDYTFSAALVAETSMGTRTATGVFDILVGQNFGTAASIVGGPQSFSARGDVDAGIVGSVDDTYDDQLTTFDFNTGTLNAGDQLFIAIAFSGTDATNPFVGIDEVQVIGQANIGARVNTTTGLVTLFGDNTFDFDITSYTLSSELGQLVPANLQSLQSQGIGDPAMTVDDGVGFELLGTPSVHQIAEGQLLTSTTFNGSTSLSLGNIFNTTTLAADRDLTLVLTTQAGDELAVLVEYVESVGLEGDFNADGVVDAADYTVWRDNLGAADESALNNNGDGGGVTMSDYAFWRARFGNSAASGTLASGTATVPEPATLFVCSVAATLLLAGWRKSRSTMLTIVWCGVVVSTTLMAAAATNDRQYDFGDDPDEVATPGSTIVGSTFDSAGTLGAGDLQDLLVFGAPTYVSASNRPGALPTDVAASFTGAEALHTAISMNAPTQMWDNATFFPGPPPQIFPHNYEGIFTHGMQLWARPNLAAIGTGTQTLVADTAEHGIGISSAGNWELLYDDERFDTGLSVASTVDSNGWVHLMQITDPAGGAFGGTLLVNGVAVLARPTFYDPEATPLVVGAGSDGAGGFTNFYSGTIDDLRLFLWGDNSSQLGADGVVGGINSGGPAPTPIVLNADGRNWGNLDLGITNDWIANELNVLGITDPGDVDLSGGLADAADVLAFIDYWRSEQLISGLRRGDWNSRQQGDLNYDGIVDLRDAFILHNSLTSAGLGGLDFSLLEGTAVPEPSAGLLLLALFACGAMRCRYAQI
jgi:hypothetical protein